MQYHDYRLRSYSVNDFGSTITLDLIFDYPGSRVRISNIRFNEVILYNFIHLGGTIITDICTTSLKEALTENDIDLVKASKRLGGLKLHEKEDESSLISKIEKKNYSTWSIESAIGFCGFIVCRSIDADETEQGAAANP